MFRQNQMGSIAIGNRRGHAVIGLGQAPAISGSSTNSPFDDCRAASEFGHIGRMNKVEGLDLLLEPPTFDREFCPQQIAPGEDFLGGKRKLHFEPPRG